MISYRVAIIPDVHIPFHDRNIYEKAIKSIVDEHKRDPLDEILILGDFFDFYWLSLHGRDPGSFDVEVTLSDEIAMGSRELTRLRELFPDLRITFLEGNHEYRLSRYITKKCPELFEYLNFHKLVPFEKLNIHFIPWGKSQLYHLGSVYNLPTNIYARHRPYSTSVNAARQTLDKGKVSLIAGDLHRKQFASCKRANGEELRCWIMGWLGDSSERAFDYIDSKDDWGHSIDFGTFRDSRFSMNFIEL
jgi:hypothetical protein